ncbi:MAG: nucleotide pyrophosphohydrolase [Bacteroidales bacterium]|nr:nucleotide pyrophosphohydrolase [Bacteroidales bacterium]MCF8405145.1 nucleotide pyrophosphohydrolase [Bacteroidales bacterium]
MDIYKYQLFLREFAKERDWDQFHTPKNLVMALAGEAGELLDVFQWLKPDESLNENIGPETRQAAKEEIADVFIYLVRLADKLDIDLEHAFIEKMKKNGKKYEIGKSSLNQFNK